MHRARASAKCASAGHWWRSSRRSGLSARARNSGSPASSSRVSQLSRRTQRPVRAPPNAARPRVPPNELLCDSFATLIPCQCVLVSMSVRIALGVCEACPLLVRTSGVPVSGGRAPEPRGLRGGWVDPVRGGDRREAALAAQLHAVHICESIMHSARRARLV